MAPCTLLLTCGLQLLVQSCRLSSPAESQPPAWRVISPGCHTCAWKLSLNCTGYYTAPSGFVGCLFILKMLKPSVDSNNLTVQWWIHLQWEKNVSCLEMETHRSWFVFQGPLDTWEQVPLWGRSTQMWKLTEKQSSNTGILWICLHVSWKTAGTSHSLLFFFHAKRLWESHFVQCRFFFSSSLSIFWISTLQVKSAQEQICRKRSQTQGSVFICCFQTNIGANV